MMSTFESRETYKVCALSACIAFAAPILLSVLPSFDLWEWLYFLLLAPFTAVVWVIVGIVRRTRRTWLTLLIFCVATVISFRPTDYFFRAHARWLILAASSKRQVLSQAPLPDGQLPHIDWDGWGMLGQDTEVYLVNDPASASMQIDKTKDGLKAKGIPCRFWRAYRLEPHWYAFVYFTDLGWDDCS